MATATVHCPTCNVDDTFSYPDGWPPEGVTPHRDPVTDELVYTVAWEHGCPPTARDAEGHELLGDDGRAILQRAYRGTFTVPAPEPGPESEETTTITEADVAPAPSGG